MSCRTKKIKYPTEGAAIKAMRRMPRGVAQHNMPYRCVDHWHIGRYTRKTRKPT